MKEMRRWGGGGERVGERASEREKRQAGVRAFAHGTADRLGGGVGSLRVGVAAGEPTADMARWDGWSTKDRTRPRCPPSLSYIGSPPPAPPRQKRMSFVARSDGIQKSTIVNGGQFSTR